MQAMSMSMAPAPARYVVAPSVSMNFEQRTDFARRYRPHLDDESRNDEKRRRSKRSRAFVDRIREAERTLSDVDEGRKQRCCLDKVLELGVETGSKSLMRDALELGADPNYRPGADYLLDRTEQASVICLLLKYGADPQLCEQPLISRIFHYYFIRPGLSQADARRRNDDCWRRSEKFFDCVLALTRKGANINKRCTKYDNPVRELIMFGQSSQLHFEIALDLLKKMVWHGAHNRNMTILTCTSGKCERLRRLVADECKKYNATIGFLSCANYEASPVHRLPRELKKLIGMLAKEGFEFNYLEEPEPAEDRTEEIPLAARVEEIQDDTLVAESVDHSMVSRYSSASILPDSAEGDNDGNQNESDRSMRQRSWACQSAERAIALQQRAKEHCTAEKKAAIVSYRSTFQVIGIAGCVAMAAKVGHAYWKQWSKRKKKQRRKEKVDKDYNDIVSSTKLLA